MTDWSEHALAAQKRLANINAMALLGHWESAQAECEALRLLATELLLACKRQQIDANTRRTP